MNRLQTLIHATGFDTFEQALKFVKEAREIFDFAEAPEKPMSREEEIQLSKALRDAAQKKIDELSK